MPPLLWFSGPDERIRFPGRTKLVFTGVVPIDPSEWRALLPADDWESFHWLCDAKRGARESFCAELRFRRPEGTFVAVFFEAAPFYDLSGIFAGYLGFGFDVEGPSQRDEPPAAVNWRHACNNRIAIIRMCAELLAESPGLSAPQVAKVREIALASDQLADLVRGLPPSPRPLPAD